MISSSRQRLLNAKAIRTVQRKVDTLGPIPLAVDDAGDVLLDSDSEELDAEVPDAAKRAYFAAQLVPLNAEATPWARNRKKLPTPCTSISA
jgi:hypothetical protein